MNINVMEFLEETIKKYGKTKKEIDLNQNTELDSLNIDSISFIKIVVHIEEVLNIQFDDDFLLKEQFETIGDLEQYLLNKM
ncbi:Phosphopantetheine attachment site [compost metagenome]